MLLGILNAQASGGGGPAYELLESVTLSSPASSVTFSGLDSYSDYKSLQIRMVTRFDTSGFASHYMNFNADEGANYTTHRLLGNGSSVSSYHFGTEDYIRLGDSERLTQSVADSFAPTIVDLLDFASTTKTTTARVLNGRTGGVSGASPRMNLSSGLWTSTDAVTSISFGLPTVGSVNYVAGCRFSLIGVR
tara:strand:- start:37 stop:609 length:573 start_codon:yes stop_codon:yes gene_type:complete